MWVSYSWILDYMCQPYSQCVQVKSCFSPHGQLPSNSHQESTTILLLASYCCNTRSMTSITGQAAVDDEEQRPLLQKHRSNHWWASGPWKIAEVVCHCLPRGFYFWVSFSWIVGCSSIISTSMQGSCQRQPCCHRAVIVVQERCCAFELLPSRERPTDDVIAAFLAETNMLPPCCHGDQEHCNAWVALPTGFERTSPTWSRPTCFSLQ